jgi:hypothetical protein
MSGIPDKLFTCFLYSWGDRGRGGLVLVAGLPFLGEKPYKNANSLSKLHFYRAPSRGSAYPVFSPQNLGFRARFRACFGPDRPTRRGPGHAYAQPVTL